MLKLQDSLLQNTASMLKKGGHLVYATCSWQVAENESRMEHFLKHHPDFQILSSQLYGHILEDSDTMFASVLQKKM